jgi:hypothetical protein
MGFFNWFKSKMFGGRILQTLGSVSGNGKGSVSVELKIHLLEDSKSNDGKAIGIEIVAKSLLSYQITPCTLSTEKCVELQRLLSRALETRVLRSN